MVHETRAKNDGGRDGRLGLTNEDRRLAVV
jgi:hypothetical protein